MCEQEVTTQARHNHPNQWSIPFKERPPRSARPGRGLGRNAQSTRSSAPSLRQPFRYPRLPSRTLSLDLGSWTWRISMSSRITGSVSSFFSISKLSSMTNSSGVRCVNSTRITSKALGMLSPRPSNDEIADSRSYESLNVAGVRNASSRMMEYSIAINIGICRDCSPPMPLLGISLSGVQKNEMHGSCAIFATFSMCKTAKFASLVLENWQANDPEQFGPRRCRPVWKLRDGTICPGIRYIGAVFPP